MTQSQSQYKVRVVVLTDRNASVACATMVDRGVPLGESTASAKREPGDVYNDQIATTLAVGRALEGMGRELRRAAERQVAAATERRTRQENRASARRLRVAHTRRRPLLPLAEIEQEYGALAADLARRRRARAVALARG